ncbi:MAG: UbiD family decarboxylase [Phycisphaerae bacterium]|nr:UbiD family decarboxylase [Phycisphaerae bacterium]
MFRSLREFLGALESAGELVRVREEVSPILEATEIVDRMSKSPCPRPSAAAQRFDPLHAHLGGRAILFEKVAGCDLPLAMNVYGSYSRVEMALGCGGVGGAHGRHAGGLEAIASRIAGLTRPQPPRSLGEAIARARQFLPLLRIGPRLVRRAACQEVVRLGSRGEVDLRRLPFVKCWPLDGDPAAVGFGISAQDSGTAAGEGRYLTFGGMHTVHADDRDDPRPASHNIGMYRAQLVDRTRLAMHWHMHHDGANHWRSWKKLGRPMPIAIALGGEGVMPYAATAPLPPGLSELLMAGFLNGRGIPLVRCRTVPIRVPANSEIVIEGFVSTDCGMIGFDPRHDGALGPGAVFEGPFGDHTGFYSLPDRYPIVEVTAVTHRRDAVFPATLVGLPPQEDYYLGKATERIFLPLLKVLIPDIEDYHLPRFGCFHNAAFVRIRKHYPLQARRVMHAVWGAGQMAWTKSIVVVDDSVDVHDEHAVLRAIAANCDFRRDLERVRGPLDILDHAAPFLGAGGKIGFDATRRSRGEEGPLGTIDPPAMPESRAVADAAARLASLHGHAGIAATSLPPEGVGAVAAISLAPGGDADAALELARASLGELPAARWIIAVDEPLPIDRLEPILFMLLSNADPERDMILRGRHLLCDATRKLPGARRDLPVRDYPPLVAMDPEVAARVESRFAASLGLAPARMFPSGGVTR